jgi:prophage regulatory protein
MKPATLRKMVTRKELGQFTGGLTRSALEAMIAKGEFPRPVRLSTRRFCWLESELISWQSKRIRERDRS